MRKDCQAGSHKYHLCPHLRRLLGCATIKTDHRQNGRVAPLPYADQPFDSDLSASSIHLTDLLSLSRVIVMTLRTILINQGTSA